MLLLTIVGMVLLQMQGIAQEKGKCGTYVSEQLMLHAHPEFQRIIDNRNEFIKQAATSQSNRLAKTTVQITVPIVFHIVLTEFQLNQIGGASGVQQRVDSQIAVINRDFNKVNTANDFVPPVFAPIQGNAEINFALACKTPSGGSTPGYEIIITDLSDFNAFGGSQGSQNYCSDVKYGNVVAGNPFPTSTTGAPGWYLNANEINYLNVWVLNFDNNSVLGIACPPSIANGLGGVAKVESGVCINYRAFGKTSSGSGFIPGAAGGRTLSHELGHYFDLRHIWGDLPDCNIDDNIGDTPKQATENTGCPNFPKINCDTTAGGEMYMNFMDYVVDNCYSMFTQQQCNVMRTAATTQTASELLNHPELACTTTIPGVVQNNFSVFPNPATNVIAIQADTKQPMRNIKLTDLTGRLVRDIEAGNSPIYYYNLNTSELPRGIYLLQCTFTNGTATKKIVLR